ncbi:hypothetical protein [Escherichia phage phiWec190]|nr:hypothetical protein [Escherichia phage phiWec190]
MALSYDRPESDYYPTPQKAINSLFSIIDFKNLKEEGFTFAEPCRGQAAAIYRHFPEGSQYCELEEGKDYFSHVWENRPDIIITNPPFKLALEFLEKSLKEADVSVYLLRLGFLESKKRRAFHQENPPTNLIVLSERPSFVAGGTDKTAYAWYVYDPKQILGLTQPFYFV